MTRRPAKRTRGQTDRRAAAPALPVDPRFVALCITSVVASALLMFVAQPMVARQLLPRFGGSPAVWTTAVVCYQALLLAGYAYAHWSLGRLGLRRQMVLQTLVLLAALLALPPQPRAGLDLPGTAWPGPWVALALVTAIGLPMFILASNASLVQRWWAASRGSGGRDPYRLYAASNVGSLAALVAYPLLIEPLLGTSAQSRLWAIGFALFAALTVALMWFTRRSLAVADGPGQAAGTLAKTVGQADDTVVIDRNRRLRWLVLAAVPASLLLSTTLAITTDMVSVPLLWVIPLAVYLITYIIAFAAPERIPRQWVAVATVGSLIAALSLLLIQGVHRPPWPLAVLIALAPLFCGGLLCHLDLARDRPPPSRLTEFYLWLALGGVIGGALNTLIAPLLFNTVVEYPLTLAILAWLIPASGPRSLWQEIRGGDRRRRALDLIVLLGVVPLAAWLAAAGGPRQNLWLIVVLAALPYGLAMARHTLAGFALAATVIGIIAATAAVQPEPVLAKARSFFGVMQVRQAPFGPVLMHGTTMHGAQASDPALRHIPATYFHPHGPLGSAVAALPEGARIGIIGLGTGALAALTRPGQVMDYFEIDPLVEPLARRHFSYLDDAPGEVQVILGDGRLRLAEVPDGSYDLLVIDAFSSDAIPVHLLTSEAMALYLDKVRPNGLVVLHISNRHLDLARVLEGWSRRWRKPVAYQEWLPRGEDARQGADNTIAAAIAPDEATVVNLVQSSGGRWWPLPSTGREIYWTDDFSNVLSVWRGQ